MGYGGKQAIRSGDIRRFNFTGNGSNTAFDLGFAPATQNQLIVTVNGLVQHYDAFSITGSVLTFTGTPASGDTIQVTAVVDAVGIAAIPDGAIANVSSLAVSGVSTLSNTVAVTGAATFSNTVAITGTANVAQGLTTNTLTVSTNTATIGNTVYVTANGYIGLGTSSPAYSLDLGAGTADTRAQFTSNSNYCIALRKGTGYIGAWLGSAGADIFTISTSNGTERLRLDASGYVTMPYQPYARVRFYGASNYNITSNATIVFNYADVNTGSCYNTSNGRFTAPVAGRYIAMTALELNGGGTARDWNVNICLRKNGSSFAAVYEAHPGYSYWAGRSYGIIDCAAGDYIDVAVSLNYSGTVSNEASPGDQRNYAMFYLLG